MTRDDRKAVVRAIDKDDSRADGKVDGKADRRDDSEVKEF